MKIKFNCLSIFSFAAFFIFLLGYNCYAQEHIISYHSYIQIHSDSSMTVTETIQVTATGEKIKHGIYRDFPTHYKDLLGNSYVVDLNVPKVTKNGLPEDFFSQMMRNGKRTYIGKKDIVLRPGEYTYEIVYEKNRQLGFFTNFDELYWNVTGHGWDFQIRENRLAAIT